MNGPPSSDAASPTQASPRLRKAIKETLGNLCRGKTVENGFVPRETLRTFMRTLNREWNERDLEEMLMQVDAGANNLIKIDAFVSWVLGPGCRESIKERFPMLGDRPEIFEIPKDATIEYATDIEGNWEYFLNIVEFSNVLYWVGPDMGAWGPGTLMLRDNGMFVFGGDAVDKGNGDIRFTKTLLSLKRRYWERVFIVIGNRDINKIRFYSELAPEEDGGRFEAERRGPYGVGAYWIRNPAYNKKYGDYIEEENVPRKESGRPLLERGHVSTLRWMLDCNMGCQKTTFETRRHEIGLLNPERIPVSDEDVVSSFRDSVDPCGHDPWMLDLLRVGQLTVLLGNTLFVHAGLPDDCIGVVPNEAGAAPDEALAANPDVRLWLAALNDFKDRQIAEYESKPLWRPDGADNEGKPLWRRGGDVLIDYGTPGCCNGKSVVFTSPFDRGNARLLSEKTEMALDKAGIRRVLSGHQPHGESPTVVRHPRTDLLYLTCDTSYSNMSAWKVRNKANNRGEIVTAVRLGAEKVELYGFLKDGSEHGCTLHCDSQKDEMPDSLVGRQLTDGSWVKTISQGNTITTLGKGQQIFVHSMHPTKTSFMLKKQFNDAKFAVKLRDMTTASLRNEIYAEHVGGSLEEHEAPDIVSTPSRRLNVTDNLVKWNREDFDDADTYILDDRGTLTSLRDEHYDVEARKLRKTPTMEENCKQVKEAVINKVNELLAKKQVVFTTNDSNFSREAFLGKLMRRGLNLCPDPQDAVYFLQVEANRLERCLEKAADAEASNRQNLDRQKLQVDARLEHFRALCGQVEEDGNPKGQKSRAAALKNIVTSAYACAWYIKKSTIKRPFVICSHPGLLQELKAHDIDYVSTLNEETGEMNKEWSKDVTIWHVTDLLRDMGDVDAVVVGWDLQITALKIAVAAALLQLSQQSKGKACRLITCSSDKSGILGITPAAYGPASGDTSWENLKLRHLGNGTMTSAICTCAGINEDRVVDVGRPSDVFIHLLSSPVEEQGCAVNLSRAVAVGDTLETDIEMANRSGMRSLLVLSGATTPEQLQAEEDPSHFPTWVLESLARI